MLIQPSTYGWCTPVHTSSYAYILLVEYAACRRTVLPLISKRWARLLQRPGLVWAEVTIDSQAEFDDGAEPDAVAMVEWFSRRTDSVRVLHVTAASATPLSAGLLTAVLMTQVHAAYNGSYRP